MDHFVYAMNSADKPPAGDGTMEGWFFYYKWDVDDAVYVPISKDVVGGPPATADTLWFMLDGATLGCVPILRVDEDAFNDRLEVVYDTRQIQVASSPIFHFAAGTTGKVPPEMRDDYDIFKQQFDKLYPPRCI